MIIGVNGRFLTKPYTGIGQHTRYLFEALALQNPDDRFIMVTPQEVNISLPKNIEIVVLKEKFPGTSGMKKTYWEQIQIPQFFKSAKVDLVHYPYPSNPWRGFSKPVFVTVHDAIPWTMAAYRKAVSTRLYQDRCRKAVRRADHVFTVSEETKKEVGDVCGIDEKNIIVTPNSVAPSFHSKFSEVQRETILRKYGIDSGKPFFLYVGGYDERKNVIMLVETFMKKIAPEYAVNLVLVGGKSVEHRTYASFDSLTKYKNINRLNPELKGDLCFTGFVPEEELPALYQSCFAFVNVSSKEGFNICLLEAAVSGTVIIASDLSVHREVIGQNALYVSPDDRDGLANHFKKLLTDNAFYSSLKTKNSSFQSPFSWEKTAAIVSEIYRRKP